MLLSFKIPTPPASWPQSFAVLRDRRQVHGRDLAPPVAGRADGGTVGAEAR